MWARILNIALGLWLMAAPGILNYPTPAADNGHIIGPVLVTFAFVACWEATRGIRKWNYPLALWLLLAPWILDYGHTLATISDMLCGAGVLVFSSIKGKMEQTFGGGWQSLWKENPEHLKKTREKNSS